MNTTDNKNSIHYEPLDEVCFICFREMSPYGRNDCGCETGVPRCFICGEPITPYNTHHIGFLGEPFHQGCIRKYSTSRCGGCGFFVSPFSSGHPVVCSREVGVCLKCQNIITPYGGYFNNSFCSRKCHIDHIEKNL